MLPPLPDTHQGWNLTIFRSQLYQVWASRLWLRHRGRTPRNQSAPPHHSASKRYRLLPQPPLPLQCLHQYPKAICTLQFSGAGFDSLNSLYLPNIRVTQRLLTSQYVWPTSTWMFTLFIPTVPAIKGTKHTCTNWLHPSRCVFLPCPHYIRTTAYHPCTNRLGEWLHRQVKVVLMAHSPLSH